MRIELWRSAVLTEQVPCFATGESYCASSPLISKRIIFCRRPPLILEKVYRVGQEVSVSVRRVEGLQLLLVALHEPAQQRMRHGQPR